MSKFTPGPWSYDQESMEISTPLRDGMSEIAVVETGWAEPFESEQQANAALIAAAPALYEALKETRKRLQDANEVGIITDTLWYSEYETLFDYVDSALALVGEQT